jgi:hypothetical protein
MNDETKPRRTMHLFAVLLKVLLQRTPDDLSGGQISQLIKGRAERYQRDGLLSLPGLVQEALESERLYCEKNDPKRKRGRPSEAQPDDDPFTCSKRELEFVRLVDRGYIAKAGQMCRVGGEYITRSPSEFKEVDGKQVSAADDIKCKFPPSSADKIRSDVIQDLLNLQEEDLPPLQPTIVSEEDVLKECGPGQQGAAGLSGVDVQSFIRMLVSHGEESKGLRVQVARLATLLTTKNVKWSVLAPARAGRLVVLEEVDSGKARPIVVGEAMMRIMSRIIVKKDKAHITKICGALNLGVGVNGGVEGLIHCFERLYQGEDPQPDPLDPLINALIDASNAFNKLIIELAILRMRVLWPRGAQYVFNCYRGIAAVLWRDKRPGSSLWILLRDGLAQGDPLAMAVFCMATIGVLKAACKEVAALAGSAAGLHGQPDDLPPPPEGDEWRPDCRGGDGGRLEPPLKLVEKVKRDRMMVVGAFADDVQAYGPVSKQIALIKAIKKHGEPVGIELNLRKTVVVIKDESDRAVVESKLQTEGVPARIAVSARNLGSVLGPEAAKRAFVDSKVQEIAKQIERLIEIAPHHPHQVYTVLRLSVLPRVTYLQRTTPVPTEVYQPVEDAMVSKAIPYLLKWEMISEAQRLMVGLPVRDGGLALLDVRKAAVSQYTASLEATAVLQSLILDRVGGIDSKQREAHMTHFVKVAASKRQERRAATKAEAQALIDGEAVLPVGAPQLPSMMRRALKRARECQLRGTGLIYTLMPSKVLGLNLDAVVLRDSIAVRYHYPTLHAATEVCTADGCNEPATLEHSLSCSKGGNVIRRHNAPLRTLQDIALITLGDPRNQKGFVKWEPVIRTAEEAARINAATRARSNGAPIREVNGLKGDLALKGLVQYESGVLVIDGRCTFPDAMTNRTKETKGLLAEQEKEKRVKHQAACSIKQMSFLPAVWTTCGAKGDAFIKLVDMLSERLSERWHRSKGRCKAWINARLAIAIAKATSACMRNLRGSLSEAANAMPLYDGAAIAGGVVRF